MQSEPAHFTPTADRLRDLRRALGCFGTGVTVITTRTETGPLGITANSFSSISLEPPLVLWSPAVASRRHDPFVDAQVFCIHVLSAHQLDLARHFAGKGDGFDAFDWSDGPLSAPRLSGCLAEFHCTRHAVHPAGDHSMILGEVRHAYLAEGDASGLLFKRGQFGHFAPEQ